MARARNIKPAIMDNEDLAELDPVCRLLFIYLWMLADRSGRMEDRPKRIAAMALPYDRSVDVDAMLESLHQAGFIVRYQSGSQRFIQIVSFEKHQSPHVRESFSVIPSHDQDTDKEMPSTNQGSAETLPRSPDCLIPDCLIVGKGDTDTGESIEQPHTLPSMSGAICVALRAEGVGSVNPSNPKLKTLIDAGAEIGLFVDAARSAKDRGKATFAYVLAVVDGQMQDAHQAANKARLNPTSPVETVYQRSMRLRYEEASGQRSPDLNKVIDITPSKNKSERIA